MSEPPADPPPIYLRPYLRAVEQHGGGFGSLLWASPATQALRFDAIRRIFDLSGKTILDAGCGRADLLDDLLEHGIKPRRYIGLEAVPDLARSAEAKTHADMTIVRGDFIEDPSLFDCGADIILFSGSLNTLSPVTFYMTLRQALPRAADGVVFNFLSSPSLASADHLTWHFPSDVTRFAGAVAARTRFIDDYLVGDCTAVMWRNK